MVSIETILEFIPAISVSIALIYYAINVRNANKTQEMQLETRQLQLYTAVFQPAQSREWMKALINVIYIQEWDDYDDFLRKYGPKTNPEAYISIIQVLELFTMVGLYVEQKALDIEIIKRHNGKITMMVWEKLGEFVLGHREVTENPLHWYSFEYLYNEMEKLYQKESNI